MVHQKSPSPCANQASRPISAGTASRGANRQPWYFVVVSDPAIKRRIRQAAEVEERQFYEHRAPPEWFRPRADNSR